MLKKVKLTWETAISSNKSPALTSKFFRKDTDMDLINYAFLSELNTDCQLEVLQYLNINDLLQVSQLETYFKELTSRWIIGKKLVHVDASGSSKVLDTFGKSIRRIRIVGSEVGVLKTISVNCSSIKLTEVHIKLTQPSTDDGISLKEFPLFPNLQKLTIDNDTGYRTAADLLKKIVLNASNLRILKVKDFSLEWIKSRQMNDLREIWICTSINVIDDLQFFIRDHPKLEIFSFTGVTDAAPIVGDCLSKHCKNLKAFYFKNAIENVNSAEFPLGGNGSTVSYRFLTLLPNLNVVSLTSPGSIKGPLMSLASKHKIKALNINFEHLWSNTSVWQLKYSVELQTIRITIQHRHATINEEFLQQNIVDIVKQLAYLEKISIRSRMKLSNSHKFLELAPNIRTLSISNAAFLHLPVEIWRIVHAMQKIRQQRQCQDGVHLIVNYAQFRELEIYDTTNTVSTTVVSMFD